MKAYLAALLKWGQVWHKQVRLHTILPTALTMPGPLKTQPINSRRSRVDPAGGVGTVTETLVQYLTPGLGVAGLIGKISKARKLGTALTRSAQVAGAGVADGIVYTDGQTTLGDFFGGADRFI